MRKRRRHLAKDQETGVRLPSEALKTETDAPALLGSLEGVVGNKATSQLLRSAFRTGEGAPDLISMQRLIGNKATNRFLQRAPEDDNAPVAFISQDVANTITGNANDLADDSANDTATNETSTDTANDTTSDTTSETAGEPVNAPDLIKLLTPQQVDRAMNFYAADPAKYTPEIIAKIQEQVGTPQTGVMDRETVQAVARHQAENPPLKVDGMAGPRTLPSVFRQGLDSTESEEKFAVLGKTRVTEETWSGAKDAEARLKLLVIEANRTLGDAGVPRIDQRFHSIENRPPLFFFSDEWKMIGFQPRFEESPKPQIAIDSLLTLTYQESRRAEQFWSMARMQAALEKDPEIIAGRLSIPQDIATKALSNPMQPNTPEFVVADGWFQDIAGVGAAHHFNTIHEFFEARDELAAAADADSAKNPTPENDARLIAAGERFQKAKAAKEDLPTEQDLQRVAGNYQQVQNQVPPDI